MLDIVKYAIKDVVSKAKATVEQLQENFQQTEVTVMCKIDPIDVIERNKVLTDADILSMSVLTNCPVCNETIMFEQIEVGKHDFIHGPTHAYKLVRGNFQTNL